MPYDLHLNLQQRAALKAAISFWEDKSVKNKVTEFLKSCGKFGTHKAELDWLKLTREILDQWTKDLLPQHLQVELIYIIKEIGKKIYNWYQYIKHEDESPFKPKEEVTNYINKIHWTLYGSVDGVATLKAFWLDNPKLNTAKVYNIACSYALEEHINDLWHKIPKNIQDSSYEDRCNRFDGLIKAYWKCQRGEDSPKFMKYLDAAMSDLIENSTEEFNFLYNLDLSIEEIMFRFSTHQGYYVAAKYFWSKLTEEKKERSILVCARIAALHFHYYGEDTNDWKRRYKRENYAEICLFLMSQMTVAHKKLFFNEDTELLLARAPYIDMVFDLKDEILTMLLSAWPWQELFITVLKDMLQYLDDNSIMMGTFLDAITNEIVRDHELGFSLENNKYRSLLRKAWLLIPGSIKQKMRREENACDVVFISNLINVRDLDTLKLILNDPNIAAVRNRFIGFGNHSYHQLILKNHFDILDQLIEMIFKSEEEKKRFKQSLMPDWYNMKDKLDLAEKLLDWQCDTVEERQFIKKNLVPDEICDWFIITEKYDAADRYINWKFENETDRKKFKNDYKNNKFTLFRLYEIWVKYLTNIDKAKEKSTEFLHWFLDSEKEISRFKKEQLFNIKITQFYTFCRDQLYHMWEMNNFLS